MQEENTSDKMRFGRCLNLTDENLHHLCMLENPDDEENAPKNKHRLSMIKYFTWILILFGCPSSPHADTKFNAASHADRTTALTTSNMGSNTQNLLKLFDNRQPFRIISFTSTINKHTTDTDTSKCSHWALSRIKIEKIIKNSEPIDGTTWDLSFSVLSCTKSVNLVQGGQHFKVEINAGSFFWVRNGDTSVLFGDYKKSDRKYFIEAPAIE